MQSVKRLSEWYLGVPPAEPGQGTDWNFSYGIPWPSWLPPWVVLLIAAGLIALLARVYWQDTRTLGWRRRAVLMMLRFAVLGFVLLFLTDLTLSIDRTGLPTVALLIDTSASMGLEDQYSDSRIADKIRELEASPPSRLNLARELLTRNDGRFLKELQRRHKLRVYRFSETAVPVGQNDYVGGDEIEKLLPQLREFTPDGPQTRPGPAVRKVLSDLRGSPPTAVVILTDGIPSTTDADKLSTVADLARGKSVQLFAVGIGSDEPARDLQLYDMLAEEVAFVGDPLLFRAKLKGYGFNGQKVAVTLTRQGSKEVLARTEITVAPDGRPVQVELSHAPSEAGEFDYVLHVAEQPKETNLRNNSEQRHVSVREERIRLLLVDSAPRYEFRYLKQLLERDKTIELHTLLQDADLEYAEEDRTALPHFPVKQDELFKYDVVVFGDVNLSYLSPAMLEMLNRFVREKGGGLILVAGPRFDPLTYQGTPLESLLPVQLEGAKLPSPDETSGDGFHPVLTVHGQKGTGIFRFAESEQESLAIWNSLPDLYWMVETPHLKPGALVLAEHPLKSGSDGRLPVIVLQQVGAGKVLYHATDELWRWRFRVGDQYYARYWVQAIRFLSRARLIGKDRTAELTTDRSVYQQGDAVFLRVRFIDERLVPTAEDGVSAVVERQGDTQRTVTLTKLPQVPNIFEGQLGQLGEGTYHAWIARPSFQEAPPATDFRVEAPLRELQKRSLERTDLMQAAKLSHGRYYSLADADQLPSDLPPGRAVPLETNEPILLWNRGELLLLFAGVLTAEWLFRKRWRLV